MCVYVCELGGGLDGKQCPEREVCVGQGNNEMNRIKGRCVYVQGGGMEWAA